MLLDEESQHEIVFLLDHVADPFDQWPWVPVVVVVVVRLLVDVRWLDEPLVVVVVVDSPASEINVDGIREIHIHIRRQLLSIHEEGERDSIV